MPVINHATPERVVLAATLWGEARGGGAATMGDVACVVLNRLHAGWEHSIGAVCLAPWQFSCINPGTPPRRWVTDVALDDPGFVLALKVADLAVAGQIRDRTGGADSYFATSIAAPYWARTPAVHTATLWLHSFWRVRPAPVLNASVVNVSAHAFLPGPVTTMRQADARETADLNDVELAAVRGRA